MATGDPNPPDGSPLPLVSVVTPSLNQGRFIEATIQSVVGQDYPRIEYLVMDGGSTDGTLEILRRHEGRLRWVSEADAGQAAAINEGFRRTSGEILGWLNSDDVYEPGAVTAIVECLGQHPEVGLVYGDAFHIDAEGRWLGPCPEVRPFERQRLIHEDFIVQPTAFFRRSAFDAVGGLDESLNWSFDYDLWLKLAGRHRVVYLPRPLASYRLTGRNKTLTGGFERLAELETVGRRHGAGGLSVSFRVEKLGLRRRQAWRLARSGHFLSASAQLGTGIAAILASPRSIGYALRALLARRRRPPSTGGPGSRGPSPEVQVEARSTDAAAVQYVEPWHVEDIGECSFYHVMDLPGIGTVGDQWDLRKTIDDYLGRFNFSGKRVLDVGAASGFLTFEMEKRGADVVSFDIDEGAEWNLVPYANPKFDRAELLGRLQEHIPLIKKAYWFAHRVLASKAKVYYGDIYDFPAGLGVFDVVSFGMVLPHLRDPFRALESASRLSRGWVIVTHQSIKTSSPFMKFLSNPATCSDPLSWWAMYEGCVGRMLGVLGFEMVSKRRARHCCTVRKRHETCTAFVGRRVHPPR